MNKFISKILLAMAISCLAMCMVSCTDSSTSKQDSIRVGIDLKFPPFSYIGQDGSAQGLEPQIAKAFGDYLGKPVEIVDTDFSLLIPALETGDIDIIIADMARTDDRSKKVAFTKPYRYTQSLALVNKDYYSKMNINNSMKPEEFFHLPGSKFVGLAGTSGVLVPQRYNAEVLEVTEIGSGIQEVINGSATALVASNEVVGFQAANPQTTMVHAIGNVSQACFAVRLGDKEMLESANAFIDSMYVDGGFYDNAKSQWDSIIAEFMKNESYGLDYIIYPPK